MDATHPRFRLDILRRFASALLASAGVSPKRASALSGQLLWFDAIDAPDRGIATLPEWLDRLGSGEVATKAEGKVGPERAATAVIDGKNGIGALILARAGEIAVEKARDVGVGLVKVRGIGPTGPATAVVAEMAVGPVMAVALGPKNAWSAAFPSAEGQPLVGDSSLGGAQPSGLISPWNFGVDEGEWLIQAVTVAALEPLASLQERVSAASKTVAGRSSWFSPEVWEARRKEARERGIPLRPDLVAALQSWSGRLGVTEPWPAL